MDLEQFTKLIDEHLGNKMLVEVKDNKIYTGFNKSDIEELYIKLNLPAVNRSLPTSTQLLSDCKKSFKDLEGKGNLDYRSYQNGYLHSFSKYVIEPSDNG